jgi:ABC-type sugar transport system permease subunit
LVISKQQTTNNKQMKADPIRSQEQTTGWLMVAPALLLLLVVYAYPILRSFWLSVFTQNLGTQLEPIFSGLNNYERMMGDSPLLAESVEHNNFHLSICCFGTGIRDGDRSDFTSGLHWT